MSSDELRQKIIDHAMDIIKSELDDCGEAPPISCIIHQVIDRLYNDVGISYEDWYDYFDEDDMVSQAKLRGAIKYTLFLARVKDRQPKPKPAAPKPAMVSATHPLVSYPDGKQYPAGSTVTINVPAASKKS